MWIQNQNWFRICFGSKINISVPCSNPDPKPDPQFICKKEHYIQTKKDVQPLLCTSMPVIYIVTVCTLYCTGTSYCYCLCSVMLLYFKGLPYRYFWYKALLFLVTKSRLFKSYNFTFFFSFLSGLLKRPGYQYPAVGINPSWQQLKHWSSSFLSGLLKGPGYQYPAAGINLRTHCSWGWLEHWSSSVRPGLLKRPGYQYSAVGILPRSVSPTGISDFFKCDNKLLVCWYLLLLAVLWIRNVFFIYLDQTFQIVLDQGSAPDLDPVLDPT